jgi:hypothetical protein
MWRESSSGRTNRLGCPHGFRRSVDWPTHPPGLPSVIRGSSWRAFSGEARVGVAAPWSTWSARMGKRCCAPHSMTLARGRTPISPWAVLHIPTIRDSRFLSPPEPPGVIANHEWGVVSGQFPRDSQNAATPGRSAPPSWNRGLTPAPTRWRGRSYTARIHHPHAECAEPTIACVKNAS